MEEAAGGAGSPEGGGRGRSPILRGGRKGEAESEVVVTLEGAIGEDSERFGDALQGILSVMGQVSSGLVWADSEG